MSEIVNIKMLDPRLQRLLDAYGNVPGRDAVSARNTRERFMTELDKVFAGQPSPAVDAGKATAVSPTTILSRPRGWMIPSLGRRSAVYVFAVLIVAVLLLAGGAGISYAAGSSLPGDRLYPLKIRLEDVRAGLAFDSATRAGLYIDFAGLRLSEIQTLIEQERYGDIPRAAREFERDIQKALDAVESLSKTDPDRAAALLVEISSLLRRYDGILARLLAGLPEDLQILIWDAISTPPQVEIKNGDEDGNENGTGSLTPLPASSNTPIHTPTSKPESTVTPSVTPSSAPTGTPPPAPTTGGGGEDGDANDNDSDDDDDDDDDD